MYKHKERHKIDIISFGKASVEKKLEKQEKVVDKCTQKLRDSFDPDTSVRRRANLRIKRDNAIERRDIYSKQLEIIKDWKDELMAEHARKVNGKE